MIMPGFTGGTLDRADRLRHDAEALAAAQSDWRARLLVLDAFDPVLDGEGQLSWTSLADAPDGAELVLLGLGERERPHFAALLPGARVPAGRSLRLFAMLGAMAPGEAATYAAARSLLDWHSRHGFCANCGQPTAIFRAGWARRCDACGTEHFPRVDPVVIMLAEHQGSCLLGRQPAWPKGRYSALAGFLEVGESIEEAVARELFEEAGVRVSGVRYIASQPWPFPSSLMIACVGAAEDDAITLDTHELEDAFWATRGEVRAALAGDPGARFLAPPPYAIAHTLLSAWAEAG
ncbi:MAG: NADH pyrophosphatase [Proteobacteria bacterium SG_bin6]|nr:MAG: NADH pyrophosphatase [Proteobacteria bacterium SG_bin6]